MKALWFASLLGLACTPAAALFKVVDAEGRVTYTDRPPVEVRAKVTPLGARSGGEGDPLAALPADLRSAMSRFPVTLYTAPDCAPCDSGRQWLQQRGIPFAERQILGNEDSLAYQRLVGSLTVPSLTIAGQVLRGLSTDEWQGYLDAAGYPAQSRLPRGWQASAPTPVSGKAPTPVNAPAPPAPAPAAPPPPAAPAAPPPPAPGSIRF